MAEHTMPDPQRLIRTVHRAAELFRDTPGRQGMVVELGPPAEDVFVTGDLHGNIAHFQAILDRARLDRHPHRHLVLQELVHGQGRYANGGCKSHQLLDVVSALKCQYPARVHLILGNHELAELIDKPIVKAGVRTNELFRRGIEVAYGDRAGEVLAAYLELIRSLPLAVRTANRIFVTHSVPDSSLLDQPFDDAIFTAQSLDQLNTARGDSVYALVWGRDVSEPTTREFAQRVGADLVITGHLPCRDGFAAPNTLRLVLDCSAFPACCCLFSVREAITHSELIGHVFTL